jgi:hypothetical protein
MVVRVKRNADNAIAALPGMIVKGAADALDDPNQS